MNDRRRSPEEGRASHVEDLINAIGGVIWEYDWTNGVYTFVSEGAEGLIGYPAESWLSPMFWTQHVHPDDYAWVRALSNQMTENLEEHEITYRMVHRDGSPVWVRDVITPRREPDGRVMQRGILANITAQKVAEQAMRQAESGFREMVEAGGRIAMQIDVIGRFTYASSALCELAGMTESELLGKPFTQLLVGEERRRMLIAHRDHMSGREVSRSFRLRVKNAKGEPRLVELQTATLYDRNGRPNGATAMGEDITDRVAMRQELERRAEEFDAVVRLLRDTYVRVNTDGTILDVKAVSSEAFLVELDAVLGKHAMQIFPPDHAEEMRQGAIRSHETGETTTVEYAIDHDSNEQQFEARLFPLAEDATAMVIRDVTERNTRERELAESLGLVERLLSLIDSGVIVLRRSDLAILSANEPAERMFGYGHGELIGLSAVDLDPEHTNADEIVRRVRGQIDERGRYDTELQFVRRDGSIFDAEASVRPIDADGTQFLVVARDVTERHRNAEREREYLERLSALSADLVSAEDRERRRLAEELHDRVSQSLAVARMHLSAAIDRAPEAVEEASASLPLLDDAIRETRAITTELSPPVLYELGIGPALHWLGERARQQHGLEVTVSVSEEVSAGEEMSAFLFRTARELLANIVKHAKTQAAWVSLDLVGGVVVLTVEDQGVGVDPDQQRSEGVPGGFGLFSVRERTRYLGGSFELESEPGHGTRVTIGLPA